MAWRREMAWRRLDEHGEERSAFVCTEDGCIVEGIGAVAINGSGFIFEYRLEHDASWHVHRAEVVSRLGAAEFRVLIERGDAGSWLVDGVRAEQFDGCTDVDLSFSPATNTTTIKRLALAVGDVANSRAILVEEPELSLALLEQSYHRRTGTTYDYMSGEYAVRLETDSEDVVILYPGRFEPALEAAGVAAGGGPDVV